jgi:hypothetical protein
LSNDPQRSSATSSSDRPRPGKEPTITQKSAWIGVASSALGIAFSMLVILFEVAQLLIYFLRAPQAGVPRIQTTAPSAFGMVCCIASLCNTGVEDPKTGERTRDG